MIKSFAHKGLEKLFYNGTIKGVPPNLKQKITDILDRLDASISIEDMSFPGSNLHRLKGKLKDNWSVKVSGNWRVIFKFIAGNAHVVDFLDYH